MLALALFAASCGGGTASNSFVATRILAFGDETSVIVDVREKEPDQLPLVRQLRARFGRRIRT